MPSMPEQSMHEGGEVAAKPQIEIRRKLGPGYYRSYANIYWRPKLAISFYAFGKWRWLCGRPT